MFIPIFVGTTTAERSEAAWDLASAVLNRLTLGLAGIALAGFAAAGPLLSWFSPGLHPEAMQVGTLVARIAWPLLVLNGQIAVLTAILNARERFGTAAMVPVAGIAFNLAVVLSLGARLGIWAVVAGLVGATLIQLALLCAATGIGPAWSATLGRGTAPMRRVAAELWPLLFGGVFTRLTTVVDVYVASTLVAGSISHLSYANRLVQAVGTVLAAGIPAVGFTLLARSALDPDRRVLRGALGTLVRPLWMLVVPAVALTHVLAVPIVSLLFRSGRFGDADVAAVATALGWYATALFGMALGTVTARVFYALGDTRTPAAVGILEMLAYAVYAPLFANRFGIAGLALAYSTYFNASLLWQLAVLWWRLGRAGGVGTVRSCAISLATGCAGAAAAHVTVSQLSAPWQQVLCGGLVGVGVHGALLAALAAAELRALTGRFVATRSERATGDSTRPSA